jgi:tetratricopeptide (TPR) repeat protein
VDDDEELIWVEVIRGASRSDVGDYETASRLLRSAVERSSRLTFGLPAAQAQTLLGRLYLLRGELEAAQRVLDHVLEQVEERGLTAFRPWPESFRAEIDLGLGDIDSAEERFEHAFALGCQVGDPCWESIAVRGLGLTAAARGDVSRALELLTDAPKLCRRLPDTYLWIEAYGLDALCSVAVDNRAEGVARWIDELESVTARRGMRELLLRATVYRARLGEAGALDAARSLAGQIDNPALDNLFASSELRAAAG